MVFHLLVTCECAERTQKGGGAGEQGRASNQTAAVTVANKRATPFVSQSPEQDDELLHSTADQNEDESFSREGHEDVDEDDESVPMDCQSSSEPVANNKSITGESDAGGTHLSPASSSSEEESQVMASLLNARMDYNSPPINQISTTTSSVFPNSHPYHHYSKSSNGSGGKSRRSQITSGRTLRSSNSSNNNNKDFEGDEEGTRGGVGFMEDEDQIGGDEDEDMRDSSPASILQMATQQQLLQQLTRQTRRGRRSYNHNVGGDGGGGGVQSGEDDETEMSDFGSYCTPQNSDSEDIMGSLKQQNLLSSGQTGKTTRSRKSSMYNSSAAGSNNNNNNNNNIDTKNPKRSMDDVVRKLTSKFGSSPATNKHGSGTGRSAGSSPNPPHSAFPMDQRYEFILFYIFK